MDISKKDQLLQLIQAHPYISQQDLAQQLGLSRSAVAGYIATLMRERRILGRAYVLPQEGAILCVGGANIDRKMRTLAPFAMATSNPVSQEDSFGGVARNIAENLARLGSKVELLTALGDDAAGQALLAHAESVGIQARASLIKANACSGSYTAVLDQAGELVLGLAHMSLCDELTPAFLRSRTPQRSAAQLTIADMNLPQDSLQLLLSDARMQAQTLVFVAVSQAKMQRLPASLNGLALLILNQGELESVAGSSLPSNTELEHACRDLQQRGAQQIIVTTGAGGVLYTSERGLIRLDASPQTVIDVTGAGDAFAAGVCWSWQQSPKDIALACQRGLQLAELTLQSSATVSTDIQPHMFIQG